MNALLIAGLFIGAEPNPELDKARAAVAVAIAKAKMQAPGVAAPVRSPITYRSPVGHTHTCVNGHTWDHQANPTHTCQFCGQQQFIQDSRPKMVTVLSQPASPKKLDFYPYNPKSGTQCTDPKCRDGKTCACGDGGCYCGSDSVGSIPSPKISASASGIENPFLGGCATGNCPAASAPSRTTLFRRR